MSSWRDRAVPLEGPVRRVSSWQARAGQGCGLSHFVIDWEHEQGKASVTWRLGRAEVDKPRINAVFSRSDCRAHPLRTPVKEACRNVFFHPREECEALNAAWARMDDPVWKERYHVRAGVEGTLSQGFIMRRCRDIEPAKTALQQAFIVTAMNVAWIVRWLDGQPRAKTRVTQFQVTPDNHEASPWQTRYPHPFPPPWT